MKDESGKRFSRLKAFAKDAFASQDYDEDYQEDDYYQDDGDSYDRAGSASDSPFDDDSSSYSTKSSTKSSTNPYSSAYSAQHSYRPPYSAEFDQMSSSSSTGPKTFAPYTEQQSNANIYKMSAKSKFRLSILRLEKLDDAVKVADEIMSGNTITLVDLRSVQKETVRRIIDFLDGVRYTCEAKMEIVADYTYVVVPKDVELSGDLFSQIETGSLS